MIKKVYFDIDCIALGTSEGPEAYYGEYYASEEFEIAEGISVTGMSEDNIRGLHRIARANRPELREMIETAHADSRAEKERYEGGLMTPLEFARAKAGIWTKVWYDIEIKEY